MAVIIPAIYVALPCARQLDHGDVSDSLRAQLWLSFALIAPSDSIVHDAFTTCRPPLTRTVSTSACCLIHKIYSPDLGQWRISRPGAITLCARVVPSLIFPSSVWRPPLVFRPHSQHSRTMVFLYSPAAEVLSLPPNPQAIRRQRPWHP